jgi:hypothetical protein
VTKAAPLRRRIKRGLRRYAQRHNNTCAVAAVRLVLARQFGVQVSEVVLEAFGTDAHEPIRKHGTDQAQMREIVRLASRAFNTGARWTIVFRRFGKLKDLVRHLNESRFPILRVPKGDDLHAIVVISRTPEGFDVFDPADGRVAVYTPRALRALWKDWGGLTWYAVVR